MICFIARSYYLPQMTCDLMDRGPEYTVSKSQGNLPLVPPIFCLPALVTVSIQGRLWQVALSLPVFRHYKSSCFLNQVQKPGNLSQPHALFPLRLEKVALPPRLS